MSLLAGVNSLVSRRTVRDRLRLDRLGFCGFLVLLIVTLAAVLAPVLGLDDPTVPNIGERLTPPEWESGTSGGHVLGTDQLGRDILSRILFGARLTLFIGLTVVVISACIGVTIGLLAGFLGGWVDQLLMRITDVQLAFPGLLLVIAVVGALGPSLGLLIVLLSFFAWMVYARLVRGLTVQIQQQPFMHAAKISGCRTPYLLRRHVLPNVLPALATQCTVEFARIVLAEASLSFLGLGVQPPSPEWGLMVAEARPYLTSVWWASVFPGAALMLTVLASNLVANSLRTSLDPRLGVASGRRGASRVGNTA